MKGIQSCNPQSNHFLQPDKSIPLANSYGSDHSSLAMGCKLAKRMHLSWRRNWKYRWSFVRDVPFKGCIPHFGSTVANWVNNSCQHCSMRAIIFRIEAHQDILALHNGRATIDWFGCTFDWKRALARTFSGRDRRSICGRRQQPQNRPYIEVSWTLLNYQYFSACTVYHVIIERTNRNIKRSVYCQYG